jgi:carbamoyltransferase
LAALSQGSRVKRILGLSAYYHDAAAALVVDGQVVAAAQEERFTRLKHDARFPANAARFCLEWAGSRSTNSTASFTTSRPRSSSAC